MHAEPAALEPGRSRPHRAGRPSTPRRRLWADRVAGWVVTAGGLAIIASILGILVFIAIEILPLFRGARVRVGPGLDLEQAVAGAVVVDPYRSRAAYLTDDGRVRVVRLDNGDPVLDRPLAEGDAEPFTVVRARSAPGDRLLTAALDDGRVVAVRVDWEVSFVEDERNVAAAIGEPVPFEMDPAGAPVGAYAVRVDDEGRGLAAAQLADGSLVLVSRDVTVNMLTDEVSATWSRHAAPVAGSVSALVLDADRRALYAGTEDGRVLWWTLEGGRADAPRTVDAGTAPVTALTLLIGDRSLVTGHADGSLAVWFPVRREDETFELTRIRDFPPQSGRIRLLSPSMRDKGFLALDSTGELGLYYSTSRRVLWTASSPVTEASAVTFAPKADGAVCAGGRRIASLSIDNPHPEISLAALFGKVWYEGYERPDHVWQSSGGTDDFEPKLSLTPLLVGTLKGTFYSLLLAIPLGVLGAMYTSQFVHPKLRRHIKPVVEIMAALPSVVLGFLAGLWLAPRVEKVLPAMLLMLLCGPLVVLAFGYGWRLLPLRLRQHVPVGSEVLLYTVALALTIGACLRLGPGLESLLFGGDVQHWLLEVTGLRYDQRNAVVVGLAMGFAVIPIIFSIAEDAFSNVPRSLVSGSLALGANRWQTVTRVVLPTASPGIFSAIMIGFGRAVGETMIVLMATGNTPIMDWSPFNGFRTLSANIAVEIPEAPHGGTLYRTLFLAALLLFALTFLINTVGDIVRQRLRKRYAEL